MPPEVPSTEKLKRLKAESNGRTQRNGPATTMIAVRLKVVTPILGGAPRLRQIDDVDKIRVPTIRGHLRFWWRALYATNYVAATANGVIIDAKKLAEAEKQLWGGVFGDDAHAAGESEKVTRSPIDIVVFDVKPGAIDPDKIRLFDGRNGKKTPGAYALFPAKEQENKNLPTAPRRKSGTVFTLILRVPTGNLGVVKNALRAWVLFGGYGGRTRRGLGSLTVISPPLDDNKDNIEWLKPADLLPSLNEIVQGSTLREALQKVFDGIPNVFARSEAVHANVPVLPGAGMVMGQAYDNAESAWLAALNWLQKFRQSTESGARKPDPTGGKRPSVSNWPEADKVRRLAGAGPWAHPPIHSQTPAWPRAGFGLPIVGQFQKFDRDNKRYPNPEPNDFQIHWDGADRLASPLIVKAMPLADGRFLPIALWLVRAYPNGQVGIKFGPQNNPFVDDSMADFDTLVADGDADVTFAPLNSPPIEVSAPDRLRFAFLNWICTSESGIVVLPILPGSNNA